MSMLGKRSRTGGALAMRKRPRLTRTPRLRVPRLLPSQRGFYRRGGYYKSPELKFFDTAPANQEFTATGNVPVTSMVLIPQGDDEDERVGRSILIKSWHLTGNIQTDSNVPGVWRIIVYLDTQCNGATVVPLDILETAEWDSKRNLSNRDRFKILYDKRGALNVGSTVGALKSVNVYRKCNYNIEYSGATGAITEIRSNNIGMLIIGRNLTGANQLDFDFNFRVRYDDK